MENEEDRSQKEFEEYCKTTKIPRFFILIMIIFVLTQMIYWTGYYFARV